MGDTGMNGQVLYFVGPRCVEVRTEAMAVPDTLARRCSFTEAILNLTLSWTQLLME
jgi:hypothetical protein